MDNNTNTKNKIAVFGGGCFWCTEAVYKMLKGVVSVLPGYAGGSKPDPTYEEVSSGTTGHAEVIKIEYDPSQISYRDLLTVFFFTQDPTAHNRQGNDVGTQYRSVILYADEDQRREAEDFIGELRHKHAYERAVVTELKPLDKFYEAESYHRDYYEKNKDKPYCQLVIAPKIKKMEEHFKKLLKQ